MFAQRERAGQSPFGMRWGGHRQVRRKVFFLWQIHCQESCAADRGLKVPGFFLMGKRCVVVLIETKGDCVYLPSSSFSTPQVGQTPLKTFSHPTSSSSSSPPSSSSVVKSSESGVKRGFAGGHCVLTTTSEFGKEKVK